MDKENPWENFWGWISKDEDLQRQYPWIFRHDPGFFRTRIIQDYYDLIYWRNDERLHQARWHSADICNPSTRSLIQYKRRRDFLQETQAKMYHNFVTKALFDNNISMPDIHNALAFISMRVRASDQNDWKKLVRMMTCSRPRHPLFLHALSFECTSKLCVTLFNQFSAYFHILKMHNTI